VTSDQSPVVSIHSNKHPVSSIQHPHQPENEIEVNK